MSRHWRMVEAVERKNLYQVYEQLIEGANVELHYVGVTPLQMAIEAKDVDIFVMLLHWKANPDKPTSSRAGGAAYASGETANQILARLVKTSEDKKDIAIFKQMQLFIKDEDARKKHVDGLQEKIEELEKAYKKARLSKKAQWGMVGLLFTGTLLLIHAIMAFEPGFATRNFGKGMLSDFCIYSPFFIGENPFVPPRQLKPGDYKYCRVLEDGFTAEPNVRQVEGKQEL